MSLVFWLWLINFTVPRLTGVFKWLSLVVCSGQISPAGVEIVENYSFLKYPPCVCIRGLGLSFYVVEFDCYPIFIVKCCGD